MKRNVKSITIVALSLFLVLILLGCATIIKGVKQDIKINSTPNEAKVTIVGSDGVTAFEGKTPAIVKLAKKERYTVTITLEGYQKNVVQINQNLEMWFIGNLICGGVIGMVVDAVTGAIWNLEPSTINVTLATAYNNKYKTDTYAVLLTKTKNGTVRKLVIPMAKL